MIAGFFSIVLQCVILSDGQTYYADFSFKK
jgi:hypothetical protein